MVRLRNLCLLSLSVYGIIAFLIFYYTDLWQRLRNDFSVLELVFLFLMTLVPMLIIILIHSMKVVQATQTEPIKWGITIIVILFFPLCLFVFDKPNYTPLVLSIAAALATTGWYVQYVNSRFLHRRQHTYNALTQFRSSPEFNKHQHNIFEHYAQGVPVPASDIERLFDELTHEENFKRQSPEDNEKPIPVLVSLRYVLNHYEFLSAAIRYGDLDKTLMRNTVEAIMTGFFRKTKSIIYYYYLQDPELFEHYRWLTTHWPDDADDSGWNPRKWQHD